MFTFSPIILDTPNREPAEALKLLDNEPKELIPKPKMIDYLAKSVDFSSFVNSNLNRGSLYIIENELNESIAALLSCGFIFNYKITKCLPEHEWVRLSSDEKTKVCCTDGHFGFLINFNWKTDFYLIPIRIN